ncbi:MAG: DEAD/DEAH box helicase [Bacteroidetes bacterium]|nr:DEAD/DEAH box helicase [Fibrella sp.]
MTFHDFTLHDDLLAGVDAMNYQQATPIQEQAIPVILAGQDLIACAQTGTGKTAAYLIPLLDKISHSGNDHTSTLILVPTRELAKQIDEQVEGFGYFVSATSIAIYGGGKGENWDQQRRALTDGADIIIATPGRLMAHMQLGYVNFKKLDYLVLDEADKMLDMGFSDDILNIVRQIPTERQTLMFSATMPNKIRAFAQRILKEPAEITLAVSKPAEKIDQQFYLAYDRQKLPLLAHLMQQTNATSMVLFTSHKSEISRIVRELVKLGFAAKGISSDSEQDEREAILRGFKNKQFSILVATDVLSRGIDIDNLSHVVNYDIPRDAEDYVHRIGRTARADTTGTAITFISDQDQDRIVKIERLLERQLEKRAITEALGLGSAPEFDPKRFSGLRAKRKPGGDNGRSGGNDRSGNGRSGHGRSGDSRPARDGQPRRDGRTTPNGSSDRRPDRIESDRQPRPDGSTADSKPTDGVLIDGVDLFTAQPQRSGDTQPEGELRKKKRRKKPAKRRTEGNLEPGDAEQVIGAVPVPEITVE